MALVAHVLRTQQFGNELEGFLEHGPILCQIHPKPLEFVLLIAGAEAHLDAPPGDDVQHGDVFGDLDRMA